MAKITRTAIPMSAPFTLRDLRLWHWFKAQAFRKSEATYRRVSQGRGFNENRANAQGKVAEWHETAVSTLDAVVTGTALQDAIAKGYKP